MAPTTSSSGWSRLAPWAGIAFVVLFAVGFFTGASSNADYDDPAGWLSDLDDSGYRMQHVVGAYLLMLSAVAFLVFSKGLLNRFAVARDVPSELADAGATLFAGIVMISGLVAASVSGAVEFGGTEIPDSGDVPIQFDQLSVALLLLPGGFSAALFIAALSDVARRLDVFPGWLVWLGYASAVVLLFAAAFIPFAMLLIWTLATSVFLLLRSETDRVEGAAPAPGG
jgi:hypothetical protein